MALELIANEDMLVKFTNTSGPGDLVYTGDVGQDPVKVVPVLSTKCKASNKKVGTTSITITWNIATGAQCPHTSASTNFLSGVGTVAATAVKVRAEGGLVLREGDTGTCAGFWQEKASPYDLVPCTCNVEISTAGQIKSKAQ